MVDRRGFLGVALAGGWAAEAAGQQTAGDEAKRKALGPATGDATTRKALKPVEPTPTAPPLRSDERIDRGLAGIRDKHKLPGIIGAVVKGDAVAAIGAVGVRKLGSDDPMRITDVVHLGSDTKAMTATMIGTLVDEGKLSWSTAVRDVFPARAKSIHPDFQGVTLWQLLTHRAGLPANGPWWELKGKTTTEKRLDLLARLMKNAPESKPGTTFLYSNVGYALAGLMAEQVTNRPWEVLMRDRLFEPLGMRTAGFGPPGTPGKLDAPWGHSAKGDPSQGDNAPALGPAGTVHMNMPDWARFAGLYIRAAQGKPRLLKAATFRTLYTPPGGGDYAGGWSVVERPWAGGKALTHSGSNTMWYCTAWLAPLRDFGVLVATNVGGDVAGKACDEACSGLIISSAAILRRAGRA